jgi:hypothetical protein
MKCSFSMLVFVHCLDLSTQIMGVSKEESPRIGKYQNDKAKNLC